MGYDTGEYFIVRPLVNELMRTQFHAPDRADLVVDNISRNPGGKPQLQRLWFTGKLDEISRSTPEPTDYDPRLRPWYIEAIGSESEIVTEPYLFLFCPADGPHHCLYAAGRWSCHCR